MYRFVRSFSAISVLALVLSACGVQGEEPAPVGNDSELAQAERTPFPLDALFAEAAQEFDVPADLLKAIAYVETRFEMIAGHEEHEGLAPAHGLMALRGEALERGAALADVPVDTARSDALGNILAAAALLSDYADELGLDRADLAAWAPAVARMSGIESLEAQSHYVHEEVYATLRQGVVAVTPEGDVAASIDPIKVEADFERWVSDKAAGPDYSGSIWRPSPNYNSRPSGSIGDPAMVVIHTCEGSYSSCWSWLTNSASGVSAHYVVKENGSEISQLVREYQRAWHIGATYQCSNNNNVDCWRNGYSSNHFTIGIEHGGYASQSSFPSGQIDASARLLCDIASDNDIPLDRYHVVAHGTLQPYNRTDPGPNWPWTTYLNLAASYCGGGGGGTIIVDSNNNNNDTSQGYIEVSGNWNSSANVAGYYGTGYWWASTESISDGASFWFYLPSGGTKTVDAWWSAAGDRSTTAPFIMYNASGSSLGTTYANQQANGGKWNTLGTFNFSAGWNRVYLSRWTNPGSVVIADAVRIR
ncbi:N-acetylmuramoyl-L-alanine amidase [Haliangium sp.]|uniref:golvesin C-terminal-like domain-containing protein n=1 Tax=Haliangium sp. TaxID=2663208 RepID=UPI003D0A166F